MRIFLFAETVFWITSINHFHTYFILTILVLAFSGKSLAQERNYVALSSAFFDILQQDEPSYEIRTEFRAGKLKLLANPFGGLMINTGGAIHFYLGLYYDIDITKEFVITPSFAPGIYENNNSKDLKYFIEFRSQLEISIKFVHGARIGVSFNHISNATLAEENPGVESLAITYIIPL